jgi:ketosteroid isomerase-like protein
MSEANNHGTYRLPAQWGSAGALYDRKPVRTVTSLAPWWSDRASKEVSVSDAREIKEKLLQALNDRDMNRVLECYSPDAVLVTPVGVAEGHEQIAWYYEHFFVAFPDMRIIAWQILPCGDTTVNEWTITGTHTGPFLMPNGDVTEGTGRQIIVRGSGVCAIEKGKIITNREYYDQLELYTQLGLSLS